MKFDENHEQVKGALERQRTRGAYALLHANGMSFDMVVQLIQTDTAVVMYAEDAELVEGDGHGDIRYS